MSPSDASDVNFTRVAERWLDLIDAVRAPEILLIDESYVEDSATQDILSFEECVCMVSGRIKINAIISHLRDGIISNNPRIFEPPGSLEEEKLSEFGSFLAREIERRIRLVFGEAPHVRLCRKQDDSSDEEISEGISEREKIGGTAGFWGLCWADMQIALAE
ncbi:uncharacterized protein K441DRAFT_673384 [Cenococcum geophilum 1.58]|uniref:uncharacterized protein n=1 Tax=Cenococcum geophilum 1.58 TaxID=794803 RepID=UPI00358E3420|nr:hypothetical protein K441DRAFT_673384 [Cenococcum geophilum 1.58]